MKTRKIDVVCMLLPHALSSGVNDQQVARLAASIVAQHVHAFEVDCALAGRLRERMPFCASLRVPAEDFNRLPPHARFALVESALVSRSPETVDPPDLIDDADNRFSYGPIHIHVTPHADPNNVAVAVKDLLSRGGSR